MPSCCSSCNSWILATVLELFFVFAWLPWLTQSVNRLWMYAQPTWILPSSKMSTEPNSSHSWTPLRCFQGSTAYWLQSWLVTTARERCRWWPSSQLQSFTTDHSRRSSSRASTASSTGSRTSGSWRPKGTWRSLRGQRSRSLTRSPSSLSNALPILRRTTRTSTRSSPMQNGWRSTYSVPTKRSRSLKQRGRQGPIKTSDHSNNFT